MVSYTSSFIKRAQIAFCTKIFNNPFLNTLCIFFLYNRKTQLFLFYIPVLYILFVVFFLILFQLFFAFNSLFILYSLCYFSWNTITLDVMVEISKSQMGVYSSFPARNVIIVNINIAHKHIIPKVHRICVDIAADKMRKARECVMLKNFTSLEIKVR